MWHAFRQEMPISEQWVYLDHAAVAPLPSPTRDAICCWAAQACQEGATVWGEWQQQCETVRSQLATLLGASDEEIALVPNTTWGISAVSEGLAWQPGDNVVTLADEFPSNQYPWLHLQDLGVEVRRLTTERGGVALQALADACDGRTRLVSLSWVGYAHGYRHDVAACAEVVHQQGALLLVDAIQGLGVFPIDVAEAGIDFLAADGHKWLLGPEGAGVLYVRREHLDRLRPLGIGWNSVVRSFDFQTIELKLKPNAARYEGGSLNMVGIHGLGASLELLLRYGPAQLAARILELTDLACERLQQAGGVIASDRTGDRRSGIVSWTLPGVDSAKLRQRFREAGVIVNCREGRLRISPHAYNNEEDVERLIDVVRSVRRA